MTNLSIKNVPESVVEKLRQRAALNHRSLQGELMALICSATEEKMSHEKLRNPPGAVAALTIEQIAAEHRKRWPKAFKQGPNAADIIRADRDAR